MNSNDWKYFNPNLKTHFMAELHLEFERLNLKEDNTNVVIPKALFNVFRTSELHILKDDTLEVLADIMFMGYGYWLEFEGRKQSKPYFIDNKDPFKNLHKSFNISRLNAGPLKDNPVKHAKRKFEAHIMKLIQEMRFPARLEIFDYFTTADGKGSYGLFAQLPKRTRNTKSAAKKIPPYKEIEVNKDYIAGDHTGRIGYYLIKYALSEYFKRGALRFPGLKVMPFKGAGFQSNFIPKPEIFDEDDKDDDDIEERSRDSEFVVSIDSDTHSSIAEFDDGVKEKKPVKHVL